MVRPLQTLNRMTALCSTMADRGPGSRGPLVGYQEYLAHPECHSLSYLIQRNPKIFEEQPLKHSALLEFVKTRNEDLLRELGEKHLVTPSSTDDNMIDLLRASLPPYDPADPDVMLTWDQKTPWRSSDSERHTELHSNLTRDLMVTKWVLRLCSNSYRERQGCDHETSVIPVLQERLMKDLINRAELHRMEMTEPRAHLQYIGDLLQLETRDLSGPRVSRWSRAPTGRNNPGVLRSLQGRSRVLSTGPDLPLCDTRALSWYHGQS